MNQPRRLHGRCHYCGDPTLEFTCPRHKDLPALDTDLAQLLRRIGQLEEQNRYLSRLARRQRARAEHWRTRARARKAAA